MTVSRYHTKVFTATSDYTTWTGVKLVRVVCTALQIPYTDGTYIYDPDGQKRVEQVNNGQTYLLMYKRDSKYYNWYAFVWKPQYGHIRGRNTILTKDVLEMACATSRRSYKPGMFISSANAFEEVDYLKPNDTYLLVIPISNFSN
jgi:hypothetical protein